MIQHFNNYTTRIKSTNILDLRIPLVLTSLCDGDSLLQRRRGGEERNRDSLLLRRLEMYCCL